MKKKVWQIVAVLLSLSILISLGACEQGKTPQSSNSSASGSSNSSNISSTVTTGQVSSATFTQKIISEGYSSKTISTKTVEKKETVWDKVITPSNGKITTIFDEIFNYSYPGKIPKSTKYGIGYYHLAPNWGSGNYKQQVSEAYARYYKSDLVNTFIGNLDAMDQLLQMLRDAKGNNNQIFAFAHTFFAGDTDREGLDTNFQKKMDDFIQIFKDQGVYDQFAGWYFDEPRGSVTDSGMIRLSKYNHDKYGKKFFVMLTPLDFDKIENPNDRNLKDPEASYFTYITDTGFSYYGNIEDRIDSYKELQDNMHRLVDLSGGNARIWHVGCTHRFADRMNEDDIIYHTMVIMDFLSREKNPGGFLGYTYGGGNNPESEFALVNITNPNGQFAYTRLKERLELIGKYMTHEGIDRFKQTIN